MSDSSIPVSVFIIAQDEAHNIGRLLDSVKQFAEIVVVDSGSCDETPKIAEEYGAKVYHQPWLGYAAQKQCAMEKCSQDWVLNLDADEVVTDAMKLCIQSMIKRDDIDAVRFQRNDLFIGKMPSGGIKKPDNVRLYRRCKAAFDTQQKVHETAIVEGHTECVDACIDHYGYDSIATLVDKLNTYSTLKADEKHAKGKRASMLKLVAIIPIEFLRKYLLQRLFMFGRRGLILAALNAHYAFMKEAKLLEHQLREKLSTQDD